MIIRAEFFSIIYYLALVIYLALGVFTISLNPKSSLNRIFFLVTIALSIWAATFSIAVTANNYEEALFWRRVASLGWGTMYSFLLHCFLILTGKSKILKNKIVYIFIYLPALINVLIFGIYSPIAKQQFNLVQGQFGWINITSGSVWDIFFNIYYISFFLIGIYSIWTWEDIEKNNKKKKTALNISLTYILSIILGTLSDIFINKKMELTIPQLGIIFALIPITAIFYSIKKHGFLMDFKSEYINKNNILKSNERYNFYRYISIAVICGGILNFGHYFYYEVEFQPVLYISLLTLYGGFILRYILLMPIPNEKQDLMFFIGISFLILFTQLWFLDDYGNNIVWVIPVIFLLTTVVFKDNLYFFLILITTLSFHFWSWSQIKDIEITVNSLDYISHIVIYGLVALLGVYINRIYRKRLFDYEKQTNLQRKISEISSDFVSVTIENLDEKIDDMLKKSGDFFGVDRSYIFKYSEDMSTAEYTNEWCNEDITPAIDMIGSQPTSYFPWWMKELEQNRKVYIKDVENLPSEASSERELLMSQEVKSLISVPILNNNKPLGFLGFDAVKSKKIWSLEHQEALQIMANILSDAMVKIEAEKKINFMAYYDALTGISNRAYFNLQLDKMIELAKRKEKLIGILFLDLDEFKAINDTMGHDSGDKLLIEIAKRLSRIVRKSDTVCRFGGDEFLVMLPHMDDSDQIKITTEKIMKIFEKPIEIKEQEFYVKTSCGVAVYPVDGLDSETLIKSADLAMYESKDSGKNRFTFCTPIMKEAIKEKTELSNDLYRALERDELILYYQPQLNIISGKIIGLEALIRWNHPERGIISPGLFIPLAEQTGLIHKIGEWVLRTACIQNKTWQSKGFSPLVMAVNLSVEQFRGDKLVEIVSKALMESNLEAKYLELEITESIAIKEPMYIIGILHQLKTLGVSISIDDFGTEYSSLSRLKELPIDRLKMAMEFVQGIDKGVKDEAIAMVIINLAKSLGLKVIAEGVELEKQLDFLKERVCDEVQGYYFYRPMPADEIEKILQVGNLIISEPSIFSI